MLLYRIQEELLPTGKSLYERLEGDTDIYYKVNWEQNKIWLRIKPKVKGMLDNFNKIDAMLSEKSIKNCERLMAEAFGLYNEIIESVNGAKYKGNLKDNSLVRELNKYEHLVFERRFELLQKSLKRYMESKRKAQPEKVKEHVMEFLAKYEKFNSEKPYQDVRDLVKKLNFL